MFWNQKLDWDFIILGDTNNDGIICGPGDEGVDEDYFFNDGIDNGGDIICEGDTNGDGIECGIGDYGVDEQIDDPTDQWYDGADNNGNGLVDEVEERYGNSRDKFYVPDWSYDLQLTDIIVSNGRMNEWMK